MAMSDVAVRLKAVQGVIADAARFADRSPEDVRLIAVSKRQSLEAVAEAVAAGQRDLGENYPQELLIKQAAGISATWHFIGALQTGTAAKVAAAADWVHGLSPGRAFGRLTTRACGANRTLDGLIQVDLAGRGSGVDPGELWAFADAVASTPGVRLRGLMTLPPAEATGEAARPYFQRLADLGGQLVERHPGAKELSMGMSLDYGIAVEEGATMVRVGTAVFGERPVVQ